MGVYVCDRQVELAISVEIPRYHRERPASYSITDRGLERPATVAYKDGNGADGAVGEVSNRQVQFSIIVEIARSQRPRFAARGEVRSTQRGRGCGIRDLEKVHVRTWRSGVGDTDGGRTEGRNIGCKNCRRQSRCAVKSCGSRAAVPQHGRARKESRAINGQRES